MRRQNVFFFLELPLAVLVTLFIAGVAVPSRVRSDKATQKAAAAGALRAISVGGMGFSYTNENKSDRASSSSPRACSGDI